VKQSFDQHAVVIRHRPLGDLLELALMLLRTDGLYLLPLFAAVAVPFQILNWFLLGDFGQWILMHLDLEATGIAAYSFSMLLLVVLEVAFAGSLMKTYLGARVFTGRPGLKPTLRNWLRSLGQMFFFCVVLRPITLLYDFVPEIIVLERTPFRANPRKPVSTWKRIRNLHRGQISLLLGEAFLLGFLGLILLVSIFGALVYHDMLLTGNFDISITMYGSLFLNLFSPERPIIFTVYFPLSLWTVFAYFDIVNFLRYMNLRIEKEGWDVELHMRAERFRLEKQQQTLPGTRPLGPPSLDPLGRKR
jgi:hypothetical protein